MGIFVFTCVCLSVCLLTGLFKNYWNFMELLDIIQGAIGRILKVKVTRGQKVNVVILRKTRFKIVLKSNNKN